MSPVLHASDEKLIQLVKRISSFWAPRQDAQESFSIFLCGAGSGLTNSLRDPVREKIISTKSKFRYQVYYPEELFAEVLKGHDQESLLTLENLLAESVDVVAIVLESPGAIAELGAFCNNDKLRERLVVAVDERFRYQQSFIQMGPVRVLKNLAKDRVIYVDFAELNAIEKIAEFCRLSSRKLGKKFPSEKGFINPIRSLAPIMILVGVLFPVNRNLLEEILTAQISGGRVIKGPVGVAINYLVRFGIISNRGGRLVLNGSPEQCAERLGVKKSGIAEIARYISRERISYLNTFYRKKYGRPLSSS